MQKKEAVLIPSRSQKFVVLGFRCHTASNLHEVLLVNSSAKRLSERDYGDETAGQSRFAEKPARLQGSFSVASAPLDSATAPRGSVRYA